MARHSHGAHGNSGGWNSTATAVMETKRAAPPRLCADCRQPMLVRRNGMGGKERCDSCSYERSQRLVTINRLRHYLRNREALAVERWEDDGGRVK